LMLGKKDTLASMWPEAQRAPPGKEGWTATTVDVSPANAESRSPLPSPILPSPESPTVATPPFGGPQTPAALLAMERERSRPHSDVEKAMPAVVEDRVQKPPECSGPMLKMVFLTSKGEMKEVQIMKRPLGAEFSKRPFNPTKVSKVVTGGQAWALGLEVGWAVKQVNGQDMTKKTFDETQKAIKKGMEVLPVTSSS